MRHCYSIACQALLALSAVVVTAGFTPAAANGVWVTSDGHELILHVGADGRAAAAWLRAPGQGVLMVGRCGAAQLAIASASGRYQMVAQLVAGGGMTGVIRWVNGPAVTSHGFAARLIQPASSSANGLWTGSEGLSLVMIARHGERLVSRVIEVGPDAMNDEVVVTDDFAGTAASAPGAPMGSLRAMSATSARILSLSWSGSMATGSLITPLAPAPGLPIRAQRMP